MSPWRSHASPRSQISLDCDGDEDQAFLPPRRVFSFDEWNEPPTMKITPQVFSFDEWTEPGGEDSNHDDQDHDHHSDTTPPTQASIFKQATQQVKADSTLADCDEDEDEVFLPPRRVFSFDEWNEPPTTKIATQVFSFDEWTDPGGQDSNHDHQDHDHHSYTTPPTQASIFKQATQQDVSTYNTLVTRRGILKDLLPLETSTQSEWYDGESDKTTRHHCQGIPRCSSPAARNKDDELATILVDTQDFWPLGITIEFENYKDNYVEDDDDDDVSTMAESSSVAEMPPPVMQQEPLLFDDDSPLRPRRLALSRHGRVQQRLVQLVPWNCWTGSKVRAVGSIHSLSEF
jgi:hypothetical protein